jgi:ferredoxin
VDLFSAAERLAAIDRSTVTFDSSRCLHALSKKSSCQACEHICPEGAIEFDKPPLHVEKECVNCFACLPVCPVGAYTGDDSLSALLTSLTRSEADSVDLLCKANPEPVLGPAENSLGLVVHGCLAGYGPGALITLAALNFRRVTLRTDGCQECSIGALLPQIEANAKKARNLLAGAGSELEIKTTEQVETADMIERTVWDAHNPPLSRRDLFKWTSRQGQIAAARAMNAEHHDSSKEPGRDRRRMIQAITHLNPGGGNGEIRLGSDFGVLEINGSCSGCQACSRGCPTGALQFSSDTGGFRLTFSPADCIACEFCIQVCVQKALRLVKSPLYRQVFNNAGPVELTTGVYSNCDRCGSRFAASSESRFCPPCEFRVKNPFGFRLPEDIQLGNSKETQV